MLSRRQKQKTGEQCDTSDPVPASKFYSSQQSGSRRVVEELPYNMECALNDTDTVSCWAAKTKDCIFTSPRGICPPDSQLLAGFIEPNRRIQSTVLSTLATMTQHSISLMQKKLLQNTMLRQM